MESSKYRIEGIMISQSPVNISDPGDLRVDLNGRRGSNGFPCTGTQRMTIQGFRTEAPFSVPIIPANTLRGILRRRAADAVEEILIARNEKLSIGAYNSMRCGASSGRPDGILPTVGEVKSAADHPFIGVFGGGPAMFRSSIVVDTAFTLTSDLVNSGIVPWVPETDAINKRQNNDGDNVYTPNTEIRFFRRCDDALTISDGKLEQVLKNPIDAIDEWQELVGTMASEGDEPEEGEKDKKENRKKVLEPIRGFTAYEYILPGTPMSFSVEVKGSSAQAGMVLESIKRLANSRIGAMTRNGFGRFFFDLKLQRDDEPAVPLFDSDGARRNAELNDSEAMIAELTEAWHAAGDSLKSGDFEDIYKEKAKGPGKTTTLDDARNKLASQKEKNQKKGKK